MTDRCGAREETERGTAVCERTDCNGFHMSVTPTPGLIYTWTESE